MHLFITRLTYIGIFFVYIFILFNIIIQSICFFKTEFEFFLSMILSIAMFIKSTIKYFDLNILSRSITFEKHLGFIDGEIFLPAE